MATTLSAVLLAALSAPDPAAGLLWGVLVGVVGTGAVAVAMASELTKFVEAARRLAERVAADRPPAPGEVAPELAPLARGLAQASERRAVELGRVQAQLATAQLVLDRSSLGLVVLDADGLITYANPVVERLFRLRSSPVGRRPLEVVPAVEVHEVVESAEVGTTTERSFATGWGDLRVWSERLDDQTVIVRIEDQSQARETERARADFVANVSHELRTPISALMGYAETLLTSADELPRPVSSMLQTIERNARRLRDLFEDLLRLHRIEIRLKELPLDHQRLQPVLVGAVIDAADEATSRGQDFALEVADDLHGWCNADALTAIVSNLARNAVSYTPEGGHIEVRAHQVDGRVRIEVRDDGIGIDPAHHERIFERFFRVDAARSRRAGGTGLGLAIVKHYARAMACDVQIDSTEGEGSVFRVTLPPEGRP